MFFFFLVIYFVSLHKRDSDSVGSVFFLYSLLSFVPGFAASYRRCRHDCMTSPLSPQACWQTWSGLSSARIRYRLVSATDIELSKELLVFCHCPGQQSAVFVLVLLCYISTVFEDQLFFLLFFNNCRSCNLTIFFFCFSSVFLRFWTECSPVCRPTEQSSSRESQRRTKIRWCPGVNLCGLCVY